MVVLFPGLPMSAGGMTVTMERAKLVTAGWLAKRWRVTAWLWRLVLVGLIAGLNLIIATGLYAQLATAHESERGNTTAALETQPPPLTPKSASNNTPSPISTGASPMRRLIGGARRRPP